MRQFNLIRLNLHPFRNLIEREEFQDEMGTKKTVKLIELTTLTTCLLNQTKHRSVILQCSLVEVLGRSVTKVTTSVAAALLIVTAINTKGSTVTDAMSKGSSHDRWTSKVVIVGTCGGEGGQDGDDEESNGN